MSVPEKIAATTAPARRGSKWLGFGLAWLVMIACCIGEVLIVDLLPQPRSFLPLFSVPWVLAILVAIAFVAAGRTRTAVGIVIGLATVLVACVALFMLLVGQLSHNFR
jgi:branched-subunit amino acid transport protein